jgi:transposase
VVQSEDRDGSSSASFPSVVPGFSEDSRLWVPSLTLATPQNPLIIHLLARPRSGVASLAGSALAEKKAEPNSGLGQAITYLLRHWRGLTAFLREANAPLDNNLCERALKRAVLHRKNALFYKTMNGA